MNMQFCTVSFSSAVYPPICIPAPRSLLVCLLVTRVDRGLRPHCSARLRDALLFGTPALHPLPAGKHVKTSGAYCFEAKSNRVRTVVSRRPTQHKPSLQATAYKSKELLPQSQRPVAKVREKYCHSTHAVLCVLGLRRERDQTFLTIVTAFRPA